MPTLLQPVAWFPTKGLDLISAPHDVGMEFAQDAFDVWVENNKDLKKRPGFDLVNTTPVSASADINFLQSLYTSNGSRYELVGTSNGGVWREVAGGITIKVLDGLSTARQWDYTQFLDTAIIADGNASLYTYNGAVSGTIAPGGFTLCVETHLNKLFTADRDGSTVRYSQTGSISAFAGVGTDAFNFEQNNGQVLTGLHSFARNELLIFKESSMGKLVGYDKPSFNLITVDTSVGCINHRTIKSYKSNTMGGLCVFAARDGLYVYDGSVPRKISEYIQTLWDTIPPARFGQMDSVIDTKRGLYILTAPTGLSNTDNNRLIVVDMKNPFEDETGLHFPIWVWRIEAQSLNQEITSSNTVKLVFGNSGGFKYRIDDSLLSDNGTDVVAYVVTPSMTGDGIVGTEAMLRRAYVCMSSASGSINIFGEIKDGEDWILQDTLEMSGGSAQLGVDFALGVSPLGFPESNFSARINADLKSRRIKVKFEQDSGDFRFTLNRPVEFYFMHGGTQG
jgi:hypothetical protein